MSAEPKRYLLTGGGTGGHVYPAIAIADELRRREPEAQFLYVGVRGKAEETIVPKRGYELAYVRSRGWPGTRPSLALLMFALSLGLGVLKSIRILLRFKPDVVIATGGYVSAPIMLAWVLLKRLRLVHSKAFVHEQNLVPGRLNKLVGRLATRVGVSFEASLRYFPNAEYLGYPVRTEIRELHRDEARAELGIPTDAKVLLAFGGSQGARTINRALVDALPHLLKDEKLWVLHGTGRMRSRGYDAAGDTRRRFEGLQLSPEMTKRYLPEEYLDPIEKYYAAADLVLCRAGAGALTEIATCGLPALIIPKANLPGDHQVLNAREMTSQHAAAMVYERTEKQAEGLIEVVHGQDLATQVLSLLDKPEVLSEFSERIRQFADADSLGRIAEKVQALASGALPPLERPELPPLKGPQLSSMTGGGLVSYLSRQGIEGLSEDEYEYLTYRAFGYLASPAWQSRNVGVKLLGLLKRQSDLELVLFLLNDPTQAPLWHRLLGGDRKQVGFIRRNIMTTLRQLDVWNEEVRQALLTSLKDPYFEVRSQACFCIMHFAEHLQGDEEFTQALMECLSEWNFEVKQAAARALGEIGTDPGLYDVFRVYYTHNNWKVRAGMLHALARLVERQILTPDKVESELEQMLMTSSGFSPQFSIRREMMHLSQSLQQFKQSQEAEEARTTVSSVQEG